MNLIFQIIQIVISGLLIVLILIQNKGTGFGRTWGSSTSFTRRGLEKIIFKLTFALAGIFIVISILRFLI